MAIVKQESTANRQSQLITSILQQNTCMTTHCDVPLLIPGYIRLHIDFNGAEVGHCYHALHRLANVCVVVVVVHRAVPKGSLVGLAEFNQVKGLTQSSSFLNDFPELSYYM